MGFLRELYIYPGRNADHDYKAYRLQHLTVEGKDWVPFINNLIIRMIQESNPNELEIFPYFSGDSVWNVVQYVQEKYRKFVPQMKQCFIFESEDDFVGLIKEIYTRINVDISSHKMAIKNYVYIIQYDGEISEENQEELKECLSYIYEYGPADGVFVFFVWENNPQFKEYTSLHMVAEPFFDRQGKLLTGVVKVNSGNDEVDMYIPFYPDTWIRKFVKTYSMNMETK